MPARAWAEEEHVSLCEILDRVLNKGVVVAGEVIISVAEIDLIYLGLHVVLTSVETARQIGHTAERTREDRHEQVHGPEGRIAVSE